jgi:hypothetical protein
MTLEEKCWVIAVYGDVPPARRAALWRIARYPVGLLRGEVLVDHKAEGEADRRQAGSPSPLSLKYWLSILAFLTLALALTASGVVAGEQKLSLRDAQALAVAIRSLDGYPRLLKDSNNNVTTVTMPYEFASGTVRAKLGNDLAILKLSEASIELTRQQIAKEVMARHHVEKIENGSAAFEDFLAQMTKALDQEAPGTGDLAHINIAELRLDKNEIPISTIAALRPILEFEK